MAAARATREGERHLQARRVVLGEEEDDAEAMYERGWSDGLPLVPPTPERVVRMLAGTTRAPDEVVVLAPPDLVECTVEKVAINAVMAGCRPEYLPVVLAALEGACTDEFNMHGLLATTWFSGPVVVVNGPVTRAIGMNNGINALGPGNRANATIGRALQLVIRNVGGGRPGEVDRATLGQPGKFTFCFAEHEDAYWEPMHVERGYRAEQNTVTLFAGEGIRGVVDQISRTPESLTRTFARCLRTTAHPKLRARVRRDGGRSPPSTCACTRRRAGARPASATSSARCSSSTGTSSCAAPTASRRGSPRPSPTSPCRSSGTAGC